MEATAGRERGKYFFVLGQEGDFLLLADGKSRRVEQPKRKRSKHVRLCPEFSHPVVEKMLQNKSITNSELRKALAQYSESGNPNQEG